MDALASTNKSIQRKTLFVGSIRIDFVPLYLGCSPPTLTPHAPACSKFARCKLHLVIDLFTPRLLTPSTLRESRKRDLDNRTVLCFPLSIATDAILLVTQRTSILGMLLVVGRLRVFFMTTPQSSILQKQYIFGGPGSHSHSTCCLLGVAVNITFTFCPCGKSH